MPKFQVTYHPSNIKAIIETHWASATEFERRELADAGIVTIEEIVPSDPRYNEVQQPQGEDDGQTSTTTRRKRASKDV